MFDIDAGKLLIIGVIALVVIGPKELPRVLRQVGTTLGKMRRMAGEFQAQFMDAMKEAEVDDLKKDMQKIAEQARVSVDYDPVHETNRQIRDALEDRKPTPAATSSASDPDNAIFSVDIPAPPDTPDAAAAVAAGVAPVTPQAAVASGAGPAAESAAATPPDLKTPKTGEA